MSTNWNPELYLRFNEQRTRPAIDLAARAASLLAGPAAPPAQPAAKQTAGARALDILDVGCGPGNSTAVLADSFPGGRLLGMDSSAEMIAAAQATGLAAEWQVADAAAWEPDRRFDLVFSNAVLQWLPDQAAVLGRLWSWLKPGGVLAVQVPGNGGSPLHRALQATAALSRWSGRFTGLDDALRYREPDWWHEALAALGAVPDVWETTYWHVLGSRAGLIDWYASTGMRPWLERLDNEAGRQEFKDAVLAAAGPGYPARPDGSVFFPFRRIFFTAARPAAPRGGQS
jgi:trans-aconitate 2-methyltransferase